MSYVKIICIVLIVLVSMYIQGCCSDCQKQVRMNKELGEMAYAYVHPPQLDRLLEDLVKEAINGSDYSIDKYIYARTLIQNDADIELLEDYDVQLLKGLGDERFLTALKRQDRELQDDVCDSLLRGQWHVDDGDMYKEAKKQPEYEYPKTKVHVFELSKSWFRNN